MKVYWPTRGERPGGSKSLSVAPAAEDPTARVPEWLDAEGNPTTVTVHFRNGEADVSESLGRFLVARRHAVARRPAIITQ